MNEAGLRRSLPEQWSGSGRSFGSPRHQRVADPILSKRVCFYKSGDPQFSGLHMVINNRTFKTFDALLDSLSKKVPLPFGVRNITTPHGVHAVHTLEELEDGKSYICSDMRKAKPINLALVRRKLPPWYHARPVSSRRRTVQQSRSFPGQKIQKKKERAMLRTPKWLVVFCNGAPTVQHTLVLDKRITPTFESILEYISEVIQFRVVKLHMLDGRRVDGLPGLILCSGVVVAAGREPFRPANYSAQKSAPPAMPTSKRASLRRLRSLNRKKKLLSHTPTSRKFSSSSERYMVTRIHDSIAASSFDLPSNPAHSASVESGHVLESVAEGEVEGQDSMLPADDDIEKSFRVNQDGSMTVEMKVRLTIKEEETVHWTTTLSRSSVTSQTNGNSLPASEGEQVDSVTSQSLDLQSPAAAMDAIRSEVSEEKDEEPPLQCNGALSDGIDEDVQMSPQRTPTPGRNCVRQQQASVESITSVSAEGITEGTITSFSYKEQTEHTATTEQFCMFKQKSTKPVPKPRRFGSVDGNSRSVAAFESAGVTEFLQVESSGDEVTETVLHIYEQQTCQDNFLANLSGSPFCRPSSSGTGGPQAEIWRPSTASESVSMWRAESITSDLAQPTVKTREVQATNSTEPANKVQRRDDGKDQGISSKPKDSNKHGPIVSPGKRQKEKSAEKTKKQTQSKPLPGAGLLKKSYGSKLRSAKRTKLRRQQTPQTEDKSPGRREDRHETVPLKEIKEDVPGKSSPLAHQPAALPGRRNHSGEETTPLPAFDSLGSAADKYVEKWLEQSQQHTYEESKRVHVAKVVKQLEMPTETQTSQALKTDLFPDNVRRASVKERILSFETKSSNSSLEKKSGQHQITDTDVEVCNVSAQSDLGGTQPASNGCCYEHVPHVPKVSTEGEKESHPSRTSLRHATPSRSLSMDLPSPPPPAEIAELLDDEEAVMPSETSGMFSRAPSGGSQTSDQPSGGSPTPDKDCLSTSSVDGTSGRTTSAQADGSSTPLSRAPSTKRVALVSNVSFDRKMSLRRSRLDEYTVSFDETLPAPNAALGETTHLDIEQGATHPEGESPTPENGHSRCSSAYSASLESEGTTSTGSFSSRAQALQPSEKHANLNSGSPPKRQRALPKPKLPHSQSLDVVSPAVRHGSGNKLPGRNRSLENGNKKQGSRSSRGTREQTGRSTATSSVKTEKQIQPQQRNVPNQPHTPAVIEELCVSLKSIRQMLQRRRPSRLDRSNSLPDFSSHVASSFGSSSNALLAFLSVVTLKDGVTNRCRDELRADAVSCAEALKMIGSLREIAAIEDSRQLDGRLLSLQQSASQQLMESWRSFQELSNQCKSCSSTPGPELELGAKDPGRGSDDIINEIMDNLDIPEELRAELASLSEEVTSDSEEREMMGDVGGGHKGKIRRNGDGWRCSSSEVESREKEERETVDVKERSGSEDESQGGGRGAAPGEEAQVDTDGTGYVNGAGEDPSDLERPSEEDERSARSYYVELSARTTSLDSQSTHASEEMTGLSHSEGESLTRTGGAAVEDPVTGSAAEEPDSEEELAEDQSRDSKAIVNNVFEEQESAEEAQQDGINQDVQTRTDKSGLIIEDLRSADEDSGNEHSVSEAHAETEAPKLSCPAEEEFSYYEEDLSPGLIVNGYGSSEYAQALLDAPSDGETRENKLPNPSNDVISQTIAERVSLLEKLVTDAQRSRKTPARLTVRCSSQRSPQLQSDGEDSESPTLASRSAPQSSLSFSYDSSGVVTTEPERTRVQSIREMFLAKSATDARRGNGRSPSQPPHLRAETSVSGGYQSQTSSEASGAEDESASKSVSKGFVRKTIERLYGKKDANPEQEAGERPPSAPKQKKKDHSRNFSPFHNIRSKASSELSYFNSTNALDTLNEATKCVAFKAQVRPGESVPGENRPSLIRKSVSDPAGINQGIATPPRAAEILEDAEETTPYSLFELEDKNSAQKKCTYFSLPHASESDMCQDELSAVSWVVANGDVVADAKEQSKDSKARAERNGVLPAVGVSDFKKMDNKVHPLVELPPDGEVVVAQPARGHGAVYRRAPEPDVLDLLYNFCGQNCPIL